MATTARAASRAARRVAGARRHPPGYASQMVFVVTALVPIMALFAVFAFAPIAIVAWLSLHRYNQLSPAVPFIGLKNYAFAFGQDPFFRNALGNTLKYALVAVPLNIVISLPIALALNQVQRLRAVFRTAFFLPTIASAVAASLIWRAVYDPQSGQLNNLLDRVGLPTHAWLADPATALWAVMATAIWQDLGYNILVFLAGLQTIPEDFYDAAKVDGAGPWPRFVDITIPLLSRTLLFVVVLTMISYLQQFTHVQIMTAGGPVHSSETLVLYVYLKGFQDFRMGYASAMSMVLMAVILIMTLLQMRLLRTRWEY